jgi:hypothetical protein
MDRSGYLESFYKERGFEVTHFKSENVKTGEFYQTHKEILDCETGDGLWLWKPKIILDCMDKMDDGDIIIYTDAGDLVDIDFNIIYEFSKNNDYYFTNWGGRRWPQKICTKRDCFILMDCDEEKYHETSQMEAGFLIFKKTENNIRLLKEYYHYCSIKDIVDNEPNKIGVNFDNWQFHRNDQSVLTNLIVKFGFNFNESLDNKIKNNIFIP